MRDRYVRVQNAKATQLTLGTTTDHHFMPPLVYGEKITTLKILATFCNRLQVSWLGFLLNFGYLSDECPRRSILHLLR
jgi:hypothetical protein